MFPPEHLISTPMGDEAAANVRIGAPILEVAKHSVRETQVETLGSDYSRMVCRILTKNQHLVTCSPETKLYRSYQSCVRAKNLKVGDRIMVVDNGVVFFDEVIGIDHRLAKTPVGSPLTPTRTVLAAGVVCRLGPETA